MSTAQIEFSPDVKRAGRKFGYSVAIAVNLALLFVANNILAWGWPAFITEDFASVLPWINFSLLASIVANVIYLFEDGAILKGLGEIAVDLISVFVTYQIFEVFPFDFSNYDFNWGIVTRVVLILAMVGAGIGAIAEAVKLAKATQETERR